MTSKRSLPGCILVLLACFTLDLQSAPTNSLSTTYSAPAMKVSKPATFKNAIVPLATSSKSHVHQGRVELPALSAAETEAIKKQDISQDTKRLRIGVARQLSAPLAVNAQNIPTNLWTTLPDGTRICTIHITSHGAQALRVHLEQMQVPTGARFVAYNPNSPDATVTAVPLESADVESGIWTPTVFGEDAVIECQLPPSSDAASVSFSITEISHRYRGPKATASDTPELCEIDVVCHPEWRDAAAGVAVIDFIEKGNEFVCTGCLLNDSDPETVENYFLTAHHCINSKTVAATAETIWGLQATACGDPNSVDPGTTITGGADLLATSSGSDFALLRLREDPPGGVTYEGWTTALYSPGDDVVGIHQPAGLQKSISFGNITRNNSDFWFVEWSNGVTEPGSSGSPLFNADQNVTGQLWGGSSDCANQTGEDKYGRFDLTYPKIRKWIDNFAFLRVQGGYNGLFVDSGTPATQSSGFLTLTLRDQGSYSGSVQVAGKRYSISGKFTQSDNVGVASNNVSRAGLNALTVQMTLNVASGAETITGTVSDGTWTADLLAKRAAFNAKTNPSPFAPKYTLELPGGDPSRAPGGFSFASISVDMNGKAKVATSLSDGTKTTQSVPIAPDGTLPMFANLYGGKGVVNGWLTFSGGTPPANIGGPVTWIKDPIPTGKFYPGGFTLTPSAAGELYAPPVSGSPILPFASGTVSFSGGNLDTDFSNDITLGANNKVMNTSPNKLSMSFVPSTGLFNGSVTPPSGGRAFPYHGIVLGISGIGYGYFLGTSESGSVTVQGP
jgi:hypothetical protein